MCNCLGLFYYTLGNLDLVLRSSLQNIHLLCVAKYEVVKKKYGIEEILKPILESIKGLEKLQAVLLILATGCILYLSFRKRV